MSKLTLKIDKGGSIEAEGLIGKDSDGVVTINIKKGTDAMFNAIMFNATIIVQLPSVNKPKRQILSDYKILNGTVHNSDGSIVVKLQML